MKVPILCSKGIRIGALSLSLLGLIVAATALFLGGGDEAAAGTTRHYYVAADEVEWDYAPTDVNQITGVAFGDPDVPPFEPTIFTEQGENRIGDTYLKCLYREYTDDTFTTLKERPPEWEHLGVLGPLVRAGVGDTIMFHFKNNCRFYNSVHPHGVIYDKQSEGAPYNDGTADPPLDPTDPDKGDDLVPPGGEWTYVWPVPERSGPGPGDPNSIAWMYHGHVDESGDSNAGLVGPIIIAGKGDIDKDTGRPEEVDREFFTMFTILDENRSPYIDQNIETYIEDEGNLTVPAEELKENEVFEESNLMHSINGFVFGNMVDPFTEEPLIQMNMGENVRVYYLGMGTEVDLHTPHTHGVTFLHNENRTDILMLMPGFMTTTDMVPDNPGTWLFHCHVNDHIDAGMMDRFTVLP